MSLCAKELENAELIARTISHPRIWPSVSDDGSPYPDDYAPVVGEGIVYLGMYEQDEYLGLFMLHPHNAICWEVHTCLLPVAWGVTARSCAELCIEWAFSMTGCCRLITNVPASNKLALRLAKSVGMQQFGINPKSFLKHGVALDQIMLGISKE